MAANMSDRFPLSKRRDVSNSPFDPSAGHRALHGVRCPLSVA